MNTLLIALASATRCSSLGDRFRREDYDVLEARRGAEVMRFAGLYEPDLVIIDADLPDVSGLTVCERLRTRGSDVPLILLIASGREAEGVLGLRAGADDYLVHPVGFHELAARAQALLRRSGERSGSADVHTIGDVRVDFGRYLATKGNAPLKLTALEFDLLRELANRRGEVVARDELLGALWGDAGTAESRRLDVHVARLRRKIEADPREPRHILTVHSRGYRLAR